jgi:hypothetical protein
MRRISIEPDMGEFFSSSGIMKTAIYEMCLFCKPYQAASAMASIFELHKLGVTPFDKRGT